MKKTATWVLGLGLAMLATGCAAGAERFAEPGAAGFWAGLWHGLICCVTFVISLFNDRVWIYQINHAGPLYDLGFVLGAALAFGGCGGSQCRWACKSGAEKEWEDLARKIEKKVRKGIRESLDEDGRKGDDWEEIARKVEEKVKRELREWAEK
jgi:hypothetical protein